VFGNAELPPPRPVRNALWGSAPSLAPAAGLLVDRFPRLDRWPRPGWLPAWIEPLDAAAVAGRLTAQVTVPKTVNNWSSAWPLPGIEPTSTLCLMLDLTLPGGRGNLSLASGDWPSLPRGPWPKLVGGGLLDLAGRSVRPRGPFLPFALVPQP